ncbi:MAG: RidA family protein [Microbacteriaceae bacterium]|jgi:enamine deaminase RidA (YjgF/YER057c/UK114 family)|nr:RidA family protein [Microbacteriaceae bacterium]
MVADKLISSGGPWEDIIGYSRATVAGPSVYVSGTTATVNGELQHVGDAYGQTKVALGIITAALAEAGHSVTDVVRTRMFLANASDMDAVGKAHGEVFGSIKPAATMIAGLDFINPDMLVEIEVDSYRV